jgi:hypothetical protein
MIDGGSIRIRSNGRPPLDALVTPVIALGSGEDGTPRITKGIKGNDEGITDSGHCG